MYIQYMTGFISFDDLKTFMKKLPLPLGMAGMPCTNKQILRRGGWFMYSYLYIFVHRYIHTHIQEENITPNR